MEIIHYIYHQSSALSRTPAKIREMASTPTNADAVSEFAGQLFFRLWRASHMRTAEALESVGLTPALFGVLNVLGAREGAIQQQLSSDMGIDPSTMVTLIDELERSGLAERGRRPGDRRAWEVAITPKGRRSPALSPASTSSSTCAANRLARSEPPRLSRRGAQRRAIS